MQKAKIIQERVNKEVGEDNFTRYFKLEEEMGGYTLTTGYNKNGCLDVAVHVNDGNIIISYFNGTYINRSELWVSKKFDAEKAANEAADILLTYLRQGARRIDKSVGNKIISSTLEVRDPDGKVLDKTIDIKGFKLFGKRNTKEIVYKPLLPEGDITTVEDT